MHHVLTSNQYSINRNSISQSVPVIWLKKAEDIELRIRKLHKKGDFDVVIKADETSVLFHI
jgi:hypothetical protein